MKKLTSILLTAITLILTTCFSTNAIKPSEVIDIEYFDDGSYIVVTIEEVSSTKGSKTKTKNYYFHNSNEVLQWKATLTASFTYNGSTASCTSASASYVIYDNSWHNTQSTASKSGATATGNFTFKHYVLGIPTKTINKTLTLTCDRNGNIT